MKNHLFYKLSAIIQGARIKTLPAILTPVAMSSALAFHQTGFLRIDILVFTLLSALCIQISANFFNDGLDFKEGIDLPDRKGPERLTQSGKLSFFQTQNLGWLFCALAFLFGLPLVLKGGWPIFLLGALSCLLAYFYTAGPFSLLKTSLSEFFVFLFFGPVAVIGTYYLQSLQYESFLIYLGLPCGFWALSLLLVNHLRDEEEDRRGKRKHFVTQYGRESALLLLIVIQAFIYLICFYWMGQGLKSGAFSFFVMPFSIALLYLICNSPPSKKYNFYLGFCSLIYMFFGLAWILGLLY